MKRTYQTLFDVSTLLTLILLGIATTKGQSINEEISYTSVFKGLILDADSKQPLPGATVFITNSDPIIGTVTDINGNYRLENIPVGRHSITISFIGYETQVYPNAIAYSGRESMFNFSLNELSMGLNEVVVTASGDNGKPMNDMALISARSVTTEEMNRLSASFNDPARVTSNFAGVTNSQNGGNDIIVRGNSPKYMQWRLEGMPITNPNHFADQSAAMGSTSALNANLLSTSDFYTGAFPAEFGNTISGIYDIKLRNGNSDKLEGIAGIGLIGTDLTLEGPLKKGYKGSFLVNYRYSTSSILSEAGLLDIEGDPVFQDAAFKLYLPTKKFGTFSWFGLGGRSTFHLKDATNVSWSMPTDDNMNGEFNEDYDKATYLFNTGLNHFITVDNKSFLKTALSFSAEGIDDDILRKFENGFTTPSLQSELLKSTYRAESKYQRKINAKNTFQTGAIYTLFTESFTQKQLNSADSTLETPLSFDEKLGNLRSFISWKHQVTGNIDIVAGMHNTNVFFNNKYTIEPRLSASWQFTEKDNIRFGYGLHTVMENVHHYFAEIEQLDDSYKQTNLDLNLLKSHHFVLGYTHHFTPQLSLTSEVYYQYLYDLPVSNDPNSTFSTINESNNIDYVELVNEGTGKNYGLELTLQKSFHKNYYFLFNTSLYESKYETLEGVERNTRFNGNYVVNAIGGKEFTNLGKKKNKTLALNAKVFVGGGQKVIPLLRDANGNLAVDPENGQYWDYDKAYEQSLEDLYAVTLSGSYKIEKKSTTHEIFFNLENITDNKGKLTEYYDESEQGGVGYTTQFGLLPNIMYRIYF